MSLPVSHLDNKILDFKLESDQVVDGIFEGFLRRGKCILVVKEIKFVAIGWTVGVLKRGPQPLLLFFH